MTLGVKFGPAAEAEIDEALVWYENQSQGLGAELARAIRVAESILKMDPHRFPVLYTSVSAASGASRIAAPLPFQLALCRRRQFGNGYRLHARPPRSEAVAEALRPPTKRLSMV